MTDAPSAEPTPAAAAQLPLLPARPPALGELTLVPLDRFPADADLPSPPPSPQLVESVRVWGVLEPLLVRAVGGALRYDDPATFVAGRRRLKALRQLHAEARHHLDRAARGAASRVKSGDLKQDPLYAEAYERFRGLTRAPVRVISDPEGALGDGRTEALLVATNAVRRDNAQADFKALAVLLDRGTQAGLSERQALAEASKATGLAPATIRQRLRLAELTAELQDDFLAGRLGYTVAMHASRLGSAGQALLAARLDRGERVTLDAVKEAKREAVAEYQTGLFDRLPGLPPLELGPAAPLADRARRLLDELDAVNLSLCRDAAGIIRELLAERPAEEATEGTAP